MKSRKLHAMLMTAAMVTGFAALGQAVAQIVVPPNTQADVPGPGKWIRQAGMMEAVSEHSVSMIDSKMYIVAGMPLTRISTSTVEIFDIPTNKWSIGLPY